MHSPLLESFQRILRDTPDRPLLYLPAANTAMTTSALWEAAHDLSAALDEARVNPRGLVLAVLGNRPAYLAAFLACRMRNQPLCPLDASMMPNEIVTVAGELGACAVLTSDAASGSRMLSATEATAQGTYRRRDVTRGSSQGIAVHVPSNDPGDSRHDDAVLLKMTSGSTGTPRATLTPEHVLMSDSHALMSAMHVSPDDVQVAAIPLSHAYGIGNLVVPLLTNGSPIIMRESFVPQRLLEDARRYGARSFPGVPFMFEHFVKNAPAEGWPPELGNLMSAGAPLDARMAERFRELFGVKIHPFYGTSEAGGITYDATDSPAPEGLVGTPLPGVTVELVPHDGAPAGGGRVLVRGPSVIQAYANGIDADSFVDGGYLTGDLGVMNSSGALTLCGRVSTFVNVAGRKVQPDEVERVLRSREGIEDARVLGVADERRGEQLVACVVVRGARPSVIELRQFCGARLASHKIPRAFVFLEAIPLTERGKTDKARLRTLVHDALTAGIDML